MEAILLEYAWVVLVLIGLEGLLSADNAIVLAIMVKHLPKEQQKKALFYGLLGAIIFRFAALFLIAVLVEVWWIQAIGAAYLLFIAIKSFIPSKESEEVEKENETKKGSGFWLTVLKVEIADIAFAVDSMLAAVALGLTLPHLGSMELGGLNIGQFAVVFIGGLAGVVMMRFAAQGFVKLLEKYPQLESTAMVLVGWVGVKLAVMTLSHDKVGVLPHGFAHSTMWQTIFWVGLGGIVVVGALISMYQAKKSNTTPTA